MAAPKRSLDPELLVEQSQWLRRLARALTSDAAAADDLAQDALLAGLRHPPSAVVDAGGLRRWLARVARHLAWKRADAEAARDARERSAARREVDESERETQERLELQRELAEALLALPEPTRTAIVMRYFDGASSRDVAVALGISEDAARQRVSRGLAELRARLDERHRGGRKHWSALCFAWLHEVPRSPGRAGLASTATVVGWMSTKAKFAGAVVAVLICVGAWLRFELDGTAPVATAPTSVASAALSTDPAAPGESPTPQRAELVGSATPTNAEVEPDREFDLFGVVLDENAQPVAGARVSALRDDRSGYSWLRERVDRIELLSVATDAQGRFVMRPPRGVPVDLRVEHAGHAPAYKGSCHAGERVEIRLSHGARLTGRVVSKVDGSPVVGARIEVWEQRMESMSTKPVVRFAAPVTDADGAFDSGVLPAVALAVSVDADGFAHAFEVIRAAEGETAKIVFELEAGHTVRGRVTDARTGAPIAGASVRSAFNWGAETRTDADGAYELAHIARSGSELTARAPGYGNLSMDWRSDDWRDRNEPPLERVDFALESAVVVAGRVVDERGIPIGAATLAAVGRKGQYPAVGYSDQHKRAGFSDEQLEWLESTTDAEGRFEVRDARPDIPLSLLVAKQGFGTSLFTLPHADPASGRIELGDVVITAGRLVLGELVDEFGAPIPDWPVQLVGYNATRGALVPVPVGAMAFEDFTRLEFANRYQREPTALELKAFGFELAAEFDSLRHFAGERVARTDDLGRFSFADIAPGEYVVEAKEPGKLKGPLVECSVPATGSPERVRLVRPIGASITGTICDAQGKPVSEAWIQTRSEASGEQPGDSYVFIRSDSAGRFRVAGLALGRYELRIDRDEPNTSAADARDLADVVLRHVEANGPALDVRMEDAHYIVGRLSDASGAACAGAAVLALDEAGEPAARTTADVEGRFRLRVRRQGIYELVARRKFEAAGADPSAANGEAILPLRVPGVSAGGAELELRLP
jgi:RNA polymerase sigma-70 factor (ECF subfamily)